MFNLTQRQLIAFASGAALGLPLFFLIKSKVTSSTATLVMIMIMLPFFFVGIYERHGMPLEKVLYYVIQSRYLRAKKRPYITKNFYAQIQNHITIQKEVQALVQQKTH